MGCHGKQAAILVQWTIMSSIIGVIMSQESLLVQPLNTAAPSGEQVILYCKAGAGRDIYWSICANNGSCNTRISNGDSIVITDPEGKYTILSPTPGEFNLQINPVVSTDGSQYRCESSLSFFGELAFAEIIILDGPFECTTNVTLDGVQENSAVHISCSQTFIGRWSPNIRCQFAYHSTWIYLADRSLSTMTIFEGTYNVPLEFNGDHINCEVYFEHPKIWEEQQDVKEAKNIVDMIETRSWYSGVLIMTYSPKNVTILPENSVFAVGESVTCSSVANPIATYIWMNAETGDVIASGPTLQLSNNHLGVWFLRCEASNNIGHSSNTQRQIYVYEEDICVGTSSDQDSLAVIIGAVLGSVLVFSIIVNVLLFLHIKRPGAIKMPCLKQDKTQEANIQGVPTVSIVSQQGGATNRYSTNLHNMAYQYISDDDVTTTSTGDATTPSRSSTFNSNPYEPVTFGHNRLPSNVHDRTLPRLPDTVSSETGGAQGLTYNSGLSGSGIILENGGRHSQYDVPKHSYNSST